MGTVCSRGADRCLPMAFLCLLAIVLCDAEGKSRRRDEPPFVVLHNDLCDFFNDINRFNRRHLYAYFNMMRNPKRRLLLLPLQFIFYAPPFRC